MWKSSNASWKPPFPQLRVRLQTGGEVQSRDAELWRLLYFCRANELFPISPLRTWIGVDPRELISGAGGLISRFHVGRQRARIGIGRHCLVNLGLEIGCLFDQERRKLGVFG